MAINMKKNDLEDLVRESLRTRFMFEEEPVTTKDTNDELDAYDPNAKAKQQAKQLGLKSAGWGNYKDDKGDTVARIVQGHLVRIDKSQDANQSTEPAQEPPKQDTPKSIITGPTDYDPYAAPVKLGRDRPQQVSLKKIEPHNSDKVVPRPKPTGQDAIDVMTGGAGTYKGLEPIKGKVEHTTNVDYKKVNKQVSILLSKYQPIIALSKVKQIRHGYQERYNMLSTHNTNFTDKRADKLVKLQDGINYFDAYEAEIGSRIKNFQEALRQHGVPKIQKYLALKKAQGRNVKAWENMLGDEKFVQLALTPPTSQSTEPTAKDILDQETEKAVIEVLAQAGVVFRIPQSGGTGWRKPLLDCDIPFDANAEETVAKLLAKVGDPVKLMRWLIKKLTVATANGKQRLMQYIGLVKPLLKGVSPEELGVPAIPTA